MSQKKVDAYKKEKENRKQLIAKQKRNRKIAKIAALVIGAVLVIWVAYSVIDTFLPSFNRSSAAESNFDQDELEDLLNRLDAATDTDAKK